MTDAINGMPIDIRADLRLDVDGSSARFLAEGHRLRLDLDEPLAYLAAARAAAPALPDGKVSRRVVGRLADALAANGFTATVAGPGGPLLVVGADAGSRKGRLITGSGNVWIAGPRAALQVARQGWQALSRIRRTAIWAAPIVMAAGIGWGLKQGKRAAGVREIG